MPHSSSPPQGSSPPYSAMTEALNGENPSLEPILAENGAENLTEASPPTASQSVPITELAVDEALLRRLRAETQDLRALLECVHVGETTMTAQRPYLAKTQTDLHEIYTALRPAATGDDTIHHLCNLLEQIAINPLLASTEAELSAQEQAHAQTMLLDQIRRIELLVGLLTIPTRLNDWLDRSSPGYYIPFHQVFEDEVRDGADRQKVLNHLAWSPTAIRHGVVDLGSGLIFRYAEDPKVRRRNLLWLGFGLLLSIAIVMGAAYAPIPLAAWAEATAEGVMENNARALIFLVGWLATSIGVLVHMGVEGLKREQTTGLPMVLTMVSLSHWIDAKAGLILWKMVLILIAFWMVVINLGTNDLAVNTFLVGYSLDSFVGLFGNRIGARASALQQQVAGQ